MSKLKTTTKSPFKLSKTKQKVPIYMIKNIYN